MLLESLDMALSSLKANKMRSLLTMLGMIIGVAAVIAMISLGMGVREDVKNSIAGLGSNLIIVQPGTRNTPGSRPQPGTGNTLIYKDAQAIAREVEQVEAVAPFYSLSAQVIAGNQNWITGITGTTAEYSVVRNLELAEGVFITPKDVDTRTRVAVIGKTVSDNLFGEGVSPLGKNIRIQNAPFRVVGLLASKGQSMGGQDQDDTILVPLTTAQEKLRKVTFLSGIAVQAVSESAIDAAMDEMTKVLQRRHKITGTKKDDFTIMSLSSVMEAADEATQAITLLLGSIAAISLLVGGIGIMNIMLVSVTERTREIGIRKALGARYSDIRNQFLIESITVGLIGGGIGILFGFGIAYVIGKTFTMTISYSVWPAFLSFSFSLLIGLFFGIYPAQKAAKLDPIEALRYE